MTDRRFRGDDFHRPHMHSVFDAVVAGKQLGLSAEVSLEIWAQVCQTSRGRNGELDEELAQKRFEELAKRVVARGGQIVSDPGRSTLVEAEPAAPGRERGLFDEAVPGRMTEVQVNERRWERRITQVDATTVDSGPPRKEEVRGLLERMAIGSTVAGWADDAEHAINESPMADAAVVTRRAGADAIERAESLNARPGAPGPTLQRLFGRVSTANDMVRAPTADDHLGTPQGPTRGPLLDFDEYRARVLQDLLQRLGPAYPLRPEVPAVPTNAERSIAGTATLWREHPSVATTPSGRGLPRDASHEETHAGARRRRPVTRTSWIGPNLFRKADPDLTLPAILLRDGAASDGERAVEATLLPSGGAPLPAAIRARLEHEFACDLSGVRLHCDATAAMASRTIAARAFTIGESIFFLRAPDFDSPSDFALLAHEVTHVVQYYQGRVEVARDFAVSTPDHPLEREAEAMGAAIAQRPTVPPIPRAGQTAAPARESMGSADLSIGRREAHARVDRPHAIGRPATLYRSGDKGGKPSGWSKAGDWILGVLAGDFNEDPSTSQIIVRTLLTLIPIVDQVGDVEDIAAAVYKLVWQERYNEFDPWFGLVVSLFGAIPELGSALKGVIKLIFKGAKASAGKILKLLEPFGRQAGELIDKLIKKLPELSKLLAGKMRTQLRDLASKTGELIAKLRRVPRIIAAAVAKKLRRLIARLERFAKAVRAAMQAVEKRVAEAFARLRRQLDRVKDTLSLARRIGAQTTLKLLKELSVEEVVKLEQQLGAAELRKLAKTKTGKEIKALAGEVKPQPKVKPRPAKSDSAEPLVRRPKGVPSDWIAKPSKTGDGTRFVDPKNPHNSVRVMPGDPKSPFPNSRQPYVRHTRNGQSLDVNGKIVPKDTPEAHIPLHDFVWPF